MQLAGSATPALSLNELIALSSDPATTAQTLDFANVRLSPAAGASEEALQGQIASLYEGVEARDIIVANGTTGANLVALEALLSPGDHVVCMYPCYSPLFDIPKALGCEISFWRLSFENNWKADAESLKSLLKAETKMIILNNPNNPTGSTISTAQQQAIIDVANDQNLLIYADEIFRPLFHEPSNTDVTPKSLIEISSGTTKVVVTGSLSKAWGMSGIRIGWVATRNAELQQKMLDVRSYILLSVSRIDGVIASEALSHRCRHAIVGKHLDIARRNLSSLDDFIENHHKQLSWVRPEGGGTAFVQFLNPSTGRAVDDLQLCRSLRDEVGLLVSPGSLCFGSARDGDFRGFIRIHLTATPEILQSGLKKLDRFLMSDSYLHMD